MQFPEVRKSSSVPLDGSSSVGYDHGLQIHELDHLPRHPELHEQSRVEVANGL